VLLLAFSFVNAGAYAGGVPLLPAPEHVSANSLIASVLFTLFVPMILAGDITTMLAAPPDGEVRIPPVTVTGSPLCANA
jgi:hypothetical protein